MESPPRPSRGRDPRRLACEILSRLEDGKTRSGPELARLGGLLEDERDLRLATELVYGTLRRRLELDFHLERLSGRSLDRIDAAVLSPLRVGLYQIVHLNRIPESAAVNESVRLARQEAGPRAAGFVNAVLRKACRDREALRLPMEEDDPVSALSLRHSVPRWMVARWWSRLGAEETRSLLAVLGQPAGISLWVQPLRTDPFRLAVELSAEGVLAEPAPLLPGALRVPRGQPQKSAAFAAGLCYVQDEASQAIPLLLGAGPGEVVADLCAAPGGKAFGLAARVGPAGRVLALDRSLDRQRTLVENRDRLGLANVLPLVADLEQPAPVARCLSGVLLDAPCSGTGTLRRHPEIRWRRALSDLSWLSSRQTVLLRTAASLVAPGGRLVYSVCSLEPEEGEERIEDFRMRHPEFSLAEPPPGLPPLLSSAATGKGQFRTWPHRHGTDGFFAAVLVRRSHSPS